MYSRNYGRGDISAKITPPPAYSGSAIQGSGASAAAEKEEPKPSAGAFAPFSQSIPLAKSGAEEKSGEEAPAAARQEENAPETKKEKSSLLSSFLPNLSAEDLILIGLVIALALDLADRDVLLVALVAAAVIM